MFLARGYIRAANGGETVLQTLKLKFCAYGTERKDYYMKKSWGALLLIFVMLLSLNTVWAAETNEGAIKLTQTEKDKISLLYHMGIVESEEVTEENVTRGEFALWMSQLSGIGTQVLTPTEQFEDVSASHKYAKAIATVSAIGCMNGISKNEFGVNRNISRQDAMVALLRLLGYEGAAKRNGGYPDGYKKSATSLGLYKGVTSEGGTDRVSIMLMCYNALTASYVDNEGEVDKNNMLLERIHNVYKTRGTVTANRFTALDTDKVKLDTDEIEIDHQVYTTDDVSMAEYLGMYVTCYYYQNDNDEERYVVYMKEDANRNTKLVIKAEDIISAKNNVITYENEKGDNEDVTLRSGFDYVLNNRVVLEHKTSDLKIDDGELILFDTNADDVYDFVKANRIETMVYQGADNLEDIIYCKEGNIYTNPFDKEYYCEIISVDEREKTEKQISIDEMTAGDVLTVYRSEDGRYLKIYAYSAGVYGIIEEIGDDTLVINGTSYDLPLKTPKSELSVGASVGFSVDMFGRLVYQDTENDLEGPQYGYFFAYDKPKGLGKAQVKIIDGDKKLIFPIADKVCVDDGSKYDGGKLSECTKLFTGGKIKRQLIKYKLNSKGEVVDLYTSSGTSENSIVQTPGVDKNTAIKYYQWKKIWAGKYASDDNTFFLVVPDAAGEADDDELYGTEYSFGPDTNDVYCEIYDVGDDMKAGAILLYSKDPLKGVVKTTNNTAVGIIVKTTKGIDGGIVYLWANGETKSYDVNPDNLPSLDAYEFGDVVRYVIGKDGKISTLYTMLNVGSTGENTPKPTLDSDGYIHYYFGRVYKKTDDYLVMVPNRNNPDFSTDMDKRILVPGEVRNCAVVDTRMQRVVSGSFDSVSQYFDGDGSGGCYVYASIYKWTTSFDLIIYKF